MIGRVWLLGNGLIVSVYEFKPLIELIETEESVWIL